MYRPTARHLKTTILILLTALALLAALYIPAQAAVQTAAPYTCQWTVHNGTTPRTAEMKCTNGYRMGYTWSTRLNRWVRDASAYGSRTPGN